MLYETVKELCTEKKITIQALEKAAGLSNGSISKWKESNPNVFAAKAVANILGMTVDELLEKVA